MGLFTAYTLTMAAGGKSFGALGQGNLKNSAGEEIPDTITTYGSRFEKEVTDYDGNKLSCTASYQIISVIPKSVETSLTFSATFGSYPWKNHFTVPEPTVTLNMNMVDPSVFNGNDPYYTDRYYDVYYNSYEYDLGNNVY